MGDARIFSISAQSASTKLSDTSIFNKTREKVFVSETAAHFKVKIQLIYNILVKGKLQINY